MFNETGCRGTVSRLIGLNKSCNRVISTMSSEAVILQTICQHCGNQTTYMPSELKTFCPHCQRTTPTHPKQEKTLRCPKCHDLLFTSERYEVKLKRHLEKFCPAAKPCTKASAPNTPPGKTTLNFSSPKIPPAVPSSLTSLSVSRDGTVSARPVERIATKMSPFIIESERFENSVLKSSASSPSVSSRVVSRELSSVLLSDNEDRMILELNRLERDRNLPHPAVGSC